MAADARMITTLVRLDAADQARLVRRVLHDIKGGREVTVRVILRARQTEAMGIALLERIAAEMPIDCTHTKPVATRPFVRCTYSPAASGGAGSRIPVTAPAPGGGTAVALGVPRG